MSEIDSILLDVFIIAFGVVAILNGQRLYRVFVGVGGAVLGLLLADWLTPNQSEWALILVMISFGGLAAFAARYNKKIAVRAAAFVLGGYVLRFLLADSGLIVDGTASEYISIMIGGLIGVTLEVIYGTNAMIVISCFCGAALVTVPLEASTAFKAALFSGLAAVGMLLQSREWITTGDNPDEFSADGIKESIADS